MAKREGFYECVYSSDRNEYRFHLRAWNEQEAETRLRDLLLSYDIRAAGTLLIRNAKGLVVRRSGYPAPSAEDPAP